MLFADNVCEINMHRCIHITTTISCQPTRWVSPRFILPLLRDPTLLFYLLGDPASFTRGANTHPLLSLVCYQLFSPCCFTHPKTPHRSSYIFTQTTSTTSVVQSVTSRTVTWHVIGLFPDSATTLFSKSNFYVCWKNFTTGETKHC
jgi:hypothetical protein